MRSVGAQTKRLRRASQGDILRDIECIEYVVERRGIIEVSKISFPLVVVLTQDCDLEQDSRYWVQKQGSKSPSTHDKQLFNVLVAPLYNAEHVFQGTHLENLDLKMATINRGKTEGKMLMQNERPRYHYIHFPDEVSIVPMVADFKHYFSLSARYIRKVRSKAFVCRLGSLYREDLSQRFAAYLARIGLPDAI